MRLRSISPAWWVIPVAALVTVMPLILKGCSCGHDFDFHLVSWFEAAAQFRIGTLHPHWAFSPGWNAGEPRFVFYPPLSWTLGALLGLLLPWSAVPVVFTWIALAAAGTGMYRLARQFSGELHATLAAAVYIANPYMVFTAYERTAYAELLAAAWLPLLLAGVLRGKVTLLRVALPVALLWLTNAPAAVMGCYTLGVLALMRLAWMWFGANAAKHSSSSRASSPYKRSESILQGTVMFSLRVVGGLALGLGLAAFYIVPAAYERRWVEIDAALSPGMKIADNFLFQKIGDGPHDEVLHTASAIAISMLAAAAVFLLVAFMRRKGEILAIPSLAVLALLIGFMLTPFSDAVWQSAPELGFLQFPWRFIAVLAVVVCSGFALALEGLRAKPVTLAAAAIAAFFSLSLPLAAHFRQSCDAEDTVAARQAVFEVRSGSDPTDEYTPTDADNDALAQGRPSFWLSTKANGSPDPPLGPPTVSPVPMHLRVVAAVSEFLVLNLRAYPAWRVSLNGTLAPRRTNRADGLLVLPVPRGVSQIDIEYLETPDEVLGGGLSAISLGCAGVLATRRRRSHTRSRIIEI